VRRLGDHAEVVGTTSLPLSYDQKIHTTTIFDS
jgi:hypothetical protein